MMEFSALRARLMLGAASWKLKIDAYLYYAISGWAAYSQVLSLRLRQPAHRNGSIFAEG